MKKIILTFVFGLLALQATAQQIGKKDNRMENLTSLHEKDKSMSVQKIFKSIEGTVVSLQIQEGGILPEHTTKVEALLVCVVGEVVFENEKGFKKTLKQGDFIKIEPLVKHWVKGTLDSQLLLIK